MLTRIISVTAAVVVFVTTYALVLPAITMETEAQCGIEAHQHSDECYTDELVCEIPESPGHVHTDACYELSQVLVCETPEHEHSVENGCYDEGGNLICELAEHHHSVDDGCYNEVKELVCDIPESEGHTHDSSCYKKVLTCGKEVHTHSTACYHIDAASKAATEAAAVASTESAAIAGTESMMSTKASTTSEATAFTDNLSDYEIDESNVGTIGTATSTDLENVDATSTDADAAGADLGGESGTWTPAEETVDSAATETDGGAEGSTASAASSSTTSSTSSTASTSEKATEENAGYVPVLDELNINAVINDHTGIYYYHSELDSTTDSNEASTEDSDGTVTADNNNNTVAVDNNDDSANTVTDGSAIPAEDWHRIPNNTEHGETPELGESDLLRIYLAYTIPAGSLNETNTVTRYRLPANIRLSDDQIDTINSTVNGIAAQYVNMDTLEFLDVDQYNASLGIESVEGTRTPDQDIQDYLNDLEKSGKEASEYINATVRVENVFNEDSGDYEGQDLVFTFTPYSILKNQHEYDKDGQPTRAGEELQGWVSLDLTTDQIEWITSDNDDKKAVEKTADVVFVEKDQELDVDEISTELKLVEKASADDIPTEKADAVDTAEAIEVNETEASRDEEKEDNKAEATEDDETAENEKAVEEPAVNYPSVSFDDSITVTSGTLSTDTTGAGAEENTEITVHVEADEDTFPEGTTMRLAAVTDDQMAAVTEAVEGAMAEAAGTQGTAGRTQGFHALDISFWNADGIEIEPLKPIRVSMTSEAIKRAVEDSATAPVVVHVEDGHAAAAGDSVDEDAAASEESVVEPADDSQIAATSSDSETVDDAEAGSQTLPTASIIETATGETKEENTDTLTFEAGAFSVYAIVYTVDFHYEINGKMYEFSIPGGGFVSFTDLVEVLGITHDTNTALTLGDVEVSEAAKIFVADVAKVEFSNPELVDVSKVDVDTTVGQIKESRRLECEYSAGLTEEQITQINAQTVEAGDWALISLKAFDTEEILTVTMKDGEQWTVKVTDASYTGTKVTDLDGKTVALVNLQNNNALQDSPHNTAGRLKAVGTTYNAGTNTVATQNNNDRLTEWTFTKVTGTQDQYYIKSAKGYLNINSSGNSGLTVTNTPQALTVQTKNDGTIRIKHPNNNNAVNNWNNAANDGYAIYGNGGDNNRGEWFTAFELSNVTQTIALSPMNENGILQGNPASGNVTSTHYKNMTIDGYTIDNNNDANLDRSRIYVPVKYNDDGTATITLPSNDQLGSFKVSDLDTTHSISQDPDKYQWELHGWVNIATGEYYDVTGGPATATVNRDSLDVFYADWWAADYSYSLPESQQIQTADTSDFATIKMWDYNELYNLRNSTPYRVDGDSARFMERDSIESEEWYIQPQRNLDGSPVTYYDYGKGRNQSVQGDYFQFVDNTDSGNCWQYGTLGNQQGRNGGNQWSNYVWNGSLGILGTQGQVPSTGVLESLFPENVTPGSGVNCLGQGNYLFSYDPAAKVYSYDSSVNAAVYNQHDQRFYVSNTTKGYFRGPGYYESAVGGFFPLNDFQKPLSYNNGTTNNWMGVSMDLQFWLPDAPGTGGNKNAGNNMRFEFQGDDDVWVLIDGKLALDIGGIHEAVGGYIDFTTGEIKNAKGNTYQLSEMGIGAGAHTLSFYYLERGGNASNCKITFNLRPRFIQPPARVSTTKVTKTWSADTPQARKEEVQFTLKTTENETVNTVGYDDGTVISGTWTYVWEGLDPDKDYVVEEAASEYFDTSITSQTAENGTYEYWAPADYDDGAAFRDSTILLGNGQNDGGRLLNKDGTSVEASIAYDVVDKNSVNDDVKWIVDDYTQIDMHFYLKNSEGKYLSIQNGIIELVNNKGDASWFYMGPTGDLNDGNSNYRVAIDDDGIITVKEKKSAEDAGTGSADRVHIYKYQSIKTKTFDYQLVNTYKPPTDVTLLKVDKESGRSIADAKFTLLKGSENTRFAGLTVTALADGSAIAPEDFEWNETTIKVVTVPEGGIKIADLPNGTYTLKEVSAPAGYLLTDSGKTFIAENGVIKNADGTAHANEGGTQSNPIAYKVENEAGAALPNTGGPGTRLFSILGSILILGAGVLLWRRRRTL